MADSRCFYCGEDDYEDAMATCMDCSSMSCGICSDKLYDNEHGIYIGKDGKTDEPLIYLSCCLCRKNDVSKKYTNKISGSLERVKRLEKRLLYEKKYLLSLGEFNKTEICFGHRFLSFNTESHGFVVVFVLERIKKIEA